jgi:hypothetical protein
MRFGTKKNEREPPGSGRAVELEDDGTLLDDSAPDDLIDLESDEEPDDRRRDPLRRKF